MQASNKGSSFSSALSRLTTPYVLWGLPFVYFAVVVTFYLRTYDSAQVKITIAQMGITAVMGLWLMEKLEEKRLGLSTSYLPVYAPFVAFLISGLISFSLQSPFKFVSLDDMVRRVMYMSVALMVFDRVRSSEHVEKIIKFLLWALFASCFYGVIQFLDSRFFPPNPAMGLDIFIWRQAFYKRIFSTFGNPNFFGDYLVIMTPVVLSWALAKRSVLAWILLGMTWFNTIFTETKGAWVGVVFTFALWMVLYAMFVPTQPAAWIRKRLSAFVVIALMGLGVLFMKTPSLNPVSIPFRIYTWLSTFEMIREHPILGVGIGSFKVIYSAYRRPTIFHIEGKHNTETDHAENEHIEVVFDEGLVGFGIYIWLIFMVLFLSYKALNRWSQSEKADPRSYFLIGIISGWLGSLAHNNFDVSIRFVSSGIFMGLLPALAVGLALSDRIWNEAPNPPPAFSPEPVYHKILTILFKLLSAGVVAYASYKIFTEFYEIQRVMLGSSHPGDQLMVTLAWTFFLLLLGLGVYAYTRSILAARTIAALIIPIALAYPILFFWGWFRGDVHHNVAIVNSKSRSWDQAIHHYREVVKRNPGFIMSYYFLGNVFNDRWDMELKNVPAWGDAPGVQRRDFDRAMEIYEYIRLKLAPNYVQMHHHVGNLFLKRAEWGIQHNEAPQQIQGYYEEAIRRYYRYQAIDPVFRDNYYRLGFVLVRLGRFEQAQQEFKKSILAFKCQDLSHLNGWNAVMNNSRWTGHAHEEDIEAFVNLSNSYLMAGKYKKAVAIYAGYLKQIDPHNQRIRDSMNGLIHQKAAIMEKIKAMNPAAIKPAIKR